MSEPKPRLELVAGGGERRTLAPEAEPAGLPARERRAAPTRWVALVALLGSLLALSLWQVFTQGARIEALASELSAARAELAATRSAYREHLGRVRGSLGSLEAGLAALRELVERDPLPPPAPNATPVP